MQNTADVWNPSGSAIAASVLRGAKRSLSSVFCPVLLFDRKPETPFFSLFHFSPLGQDIVPNSI